MKFRLLFFSFISIICFAQLNTTHAMGKFVSNIKSLTQLEKVDKSGIESALGVDLLLDKVMTEKTGMNIYREGALAVLSPFAKIEMRVYDANTKYFLLMYPIGNNPFNLIEIKEAFGRETLIPEDKKRHVAKGYKFVKNNLKICFYLDASHKNVSFASVEGVYSN